MTTYYEDYEDSRGEQQALDHEARQQMAQAEAEDIMASCIDVYAAEEIVVRSEFLEEQLTALAVWLAYIRINRSNKDAVADAVAGLLDIFESEATRIAIERVEGKEIERGNPYED
jgi:isocitrate dehydrogenase kinase/phosphatase